jgi:hypothetical protein
MLFIARLHQQLWPVVLQLFADRLAVSLLSEAALAAQHSQSLSCNVLGKQGPALQTACEPFRTTTDEGVVQYADALYCTQAQGSKMTLSCPSPRYLQKKG